MLWLCQIKFCLSLSQQPRLVNSSLSASELGAGNSNIIPTKPSSPTSTITCSSEDNMPTDTSHSSSLTTKLPCEKGEESTCLPGSSIMTPLFNMLLFVLCRGESLPFTRCFEGFRERALPSSFSKRLLVSFHSDIRQIFFYGAGQCAYCVYIRHCTSDFCCYFDFVLLVSRHYFFSYYFSFYF